MTPETEAISQTKEVNLMQQLSLYQIERELLELMDLRETAETEEEKTAADQQISLYVQSEVRKVDGIVAYMRTCANMAAMASKEADRLARVGRNWLRQQERLENATLRAMLASGTQRLEGALGSFAVKKCPPSVGPELDMGLLPDEYTKVTVTMAGDSFNFLIRLLRKNDLMELVANLRESAQRTPVKTEITKALKGTEPCGCVAGVVYGPEGAGSPCDQCAGSGRVPARVAGARLITDKVRLEVK